MAVFSDSHAHIWMQEHIIYQWFETRQHFHDILAEHYVLKVKALMTEQMHNMTTG